MQGWIRCTVAAAAAMAAISTGASPASASSWQTVAAYPLAVHDPAAVGLPDGRILAAGGSTGGLDRQPQSAAYSYSPATNTWAQVAAMPTARYAPSAALGPDGKVYVIGGLDSSGNTLSVVEAYDPASNTWQTRAPLPVTAGFAAAVTGPDGRIYEIGGADPQSCCDPTATVYAYNTATNTWTQVASLGTAREELAAFVGADGRIYALGGSTGARPGDHTLDSVEAYDPATNTWSTTTSGPDPQPLAAINPGAGLASMAAASGPDGEEYLFGGYSGINGQQDTLYDGTSVYDTAHNSAGGAFGHQPGARLGAGAATGSDGRMYAIAGDTVDSTGGILLRSDTQALSIPVPKAPAALAFGAVGVGASATRNLDLTNEGPGTETVTGITVTGDPYGEFTVAGVSACAMIAGNSTCTVKVTYAPKHIGESSAALSVGTFDALDRQLSLTTNLTGAGSPGSTGALDTYSSLGGERWTTTGAVTTGYSPTGSLGFVVPAHSGANVQSLFGCLDGTTGDHFLSLLTGCGGATVLRTEGRVYRTPPAGAAVQAIYGCQPPSADRFETTANSCPGTSIQSLGYTSVLGSLGRYKSASGAWWATTGPAPGGFDLRSPLLGSLRVAGAGTTPVYSCLTGASQFLSTRSDCDGKPGALRFWQEGSLYTTKPTSTATVAVYRCTDAAGHVFLAPGTSCGGETLVDVLGYVMPQLELDSYHDAISWASTTAPISSYALTGHLGYLLARPLGSSTRVLYSCSSSSWGEYLTNRSDCNGVGARLQTEGYAYKNKPAGIDTLPLYRCTGSDNFRFMSNGPCSGQVLLGYVQTPTFDLRAPRKLAVKKGAQSGTATVRWSAPATDGGFPLTGYRLYRGTSATSLTLRATLPPGATTFNDGGLTKGTTYYYAISAANPNGEGPRGATVSLTAP